MKLRECKLKKGEKIYITGYQVTLRIPDIKKAGLTTGDELKVTAVEGVLILQKVRK